MTDEQNIEQRYQQVRGEMQPHHDPTQVQAAITLLKAYLNDNDHEMPAQDDARIEADLMNLRDLL